MNIVYLIGNGFDINLGLETRFRQFYDYYIQQDSSNDTIKNFKKDLAEHKEVEQWADLELVLGEYAKHFNQSAASEFRNLLIDIQDHLANYINLQRVNFLLSEEDKNKINYDLFFPNAYLTEREKKNFYEYKKTYGLYDYVADVITFNYTDTFEQIYEFQNEKKQLGTHTYGNAKYANILNSVEHIHGTTVSNMILGINDISQLNNDELKSNKRILRCLLKPEMNKNAGTLRDDRCLNLIQSANVICLFGMSLGKTDAIWWQAINDRLANSNATLIIFAVNKETPKIREFLLEDDKDEIKDIFLSYGSPKAKQDETIRSRIFVRLNSDMFAISDIQQKKSAA